MFKRTVIFFSLIMLCICIMMFKLDNISNGGELRDAAVCQHSYKLKVSEVRGTIYDCRNYPLVNQRSKLMAAVVPNVQTINKLSEIVPKSEFPKVCEYISYNRPFSTQVNAGIKTDDIDIFKVPIRYSGITLAPHIIGYIDSNKNGVFGIEKAYNDFLSEGNQAICVKYNVDASNRILTGENKIIDDKSYMSSKGVVLNIDKRIQSLAEEVSSKYLEKGAVVITQVPNCEIRACVSLPNFMPQSVSDYLNDKNSPLINRAACQYNVGSVFKLITVATALEKGIRDNYIYECKGGIEVEDRVFHCFNGKPHKGINMEEAIAYSCNTYFVDLIQHMNPNSVADMSRKFGLGKSIELAPGMFTAQGNIPNSKELEDEKNAANFSFGQGSLMASPIQISGLINAIASNGEYTTPTLIKGLVNENLHFIDIPKPENPNRVIKKDTAEKLKGYMKASIEYGTSLRGKPESVEAAAKTSTAETGIVVDGKKVIQAWYAGFFPFEKPKYSIVVLSEDASGGGESCGPVFKEIVDRMNKEIPELFID